MAFATEEQKQRWLPGVASGDTLLAIAMTEPGTGSDLANITTSARQSADGTHYVLNGAKTFISGGSLADLILVVCRTQPADADNRRGGLSILAVDTTSDGFAVGRRLQKLGLKANDLVELSFHDVPVPVQNLLGADGEAFNYLSHNLAQERLSIALTATAAAQAAIAFTIDYVKQRTVFGKPLSNMQNTRFSLAECAAEIEAMVTFTDRALELFDTGELSSADAAKAKLFCTERAGQVIDKCLQLHGGYGYITEYPIARLYADIRVARIYGGTSEVMKLIISKSLGL
jgi:acyl-CoA dehydrogenase